MIDALDIEHARRLLSETIRSELIAQRYVRLKLAEAAARQEDSEGPDPAAERAWIDLERELDGSRRALSRAMASLRASQKALGAGEEAPGQPGQGAASV